MGTSNSESEDYRVFLLRFWRETAEAPWRATLEDPHSGEKRSFATPDHVWVFLQDKLVNPMHDEGKNNDETTTNPLT